MIVAGFSNREAGIFLLQTWEHASRIVDIHGFPSFLRGISYTMKLNIMTATLTAGDAIGNWTKTLRRIFSLKGFSVRIYADLFDGSIPCTSSSEYESTGQDLLWYHYSIYSDNLEIIKESTDFKIMDFHGVAPSRLFKGYNPELEVLCEKGEKELSSVAPLFDFHITQALDLSS